MTDIALVTGSYQAGIQAIRQKIVATVKPLWLQLGGITDRHLTDFVEEILPIVLSGQAQISDLTQAYMASLAQAYGLELPTKIARFEAKDLRGVASSEVYARPIKEVRWHLSDGTPYRVAMQMGETRMEKLLGTDLQLAKTHASRHYGKQYGHEFYRRVTNGKENCALCLIASTQRYRIEKLMPIHPGCDCTVEPLPPGTSFFEDVNGSERVIDPDKLEEIHDAVGRAGYRIDRGGRAADYRKILLEKQHGEYGPVLEFNKTQLRKMRPKTGYDYKPAKYTDPEHWTGRAVDLVDIITDQEWTGKIRQLDDDEFAKALELSKHPAIYRGITDFEGTAAKDLQRAFLEEDTPWIGGGNKGDGWYTTTLLDNARFYAGKKGRFGGRLLQNDNADRSEIGQSIIEMALKPDAKVTTLEELQRLGMQKDNYPRASLVAAQYGFDAIELVSPHITSGERYYLIVNRTALVARKLG